MTQYEKLMAALVETESYLDDNTQDTVVGTLLRFELLAEIAKLKAMLKAVVSNIK